MTTDTHINRILHRIRAHFSESGMSRLQVAKAANICWRAVDEVLKDGGNPKLRSIMAVARLVPDDCESGQSDRRNSKRRAA